MNGAERDRERVETDHVGSSEAAPSDRIYMRRIRELEGENDHLQSYVKRLESQLRAYQLQMPEFEAAHGLSADTMRKSSMRSPEDDFGDTKEERDEGDGRPLPPWVLGSDNFSPLLAAYDQRIGYLENVLSKKKDVISQIRNETIGITKENESLRERLQRSLEKCADRVENGAVGEEGHLALLDRDSDRPATETTKARDEGVALLQHQLKNATETVDLLQQQTTLLENELDEARAQWTETCEQLEAVSRNWHDTKKELERVSSEHASLTNEKRVLLESVKRHTERSTEAEKKLRESAVCLEQKTSQIESEKARVATLDKHIEELTSRSKRERDSFQTRIKAAETASQSLKDDLRGQRRKFEELQAEHRKARRALESTRADNQAMLQVLESHERKIRDFTEREKSVTELSQTTQKQIAEAMIARDRASSRETQTRKELESLQEKLATTQANALRSQREAIQRVRETTAATVNERDREIQDLRRALTKATESERRATREKASAESEYKELLELLSKEKKRIADVTSECDRKLTRESERISKLTDAAERYKATLSEKEKHIEDAAEELRTTQSRADDLESALKRMSSERQKDIASHRSQLREIERVSSALRTKIQDQRRLVESADTERRATLRELETTRAAAKRAANIASADLNDAQATIAKLESNLKATGRRLDASRREIARLMASEESHVESRRKDRIEIDRLRMRCERIEADSLSPTLRSENLRLGEVTKLLEAESERLMTFGGDDGTAGDRNFEGSKREY